MEMSTTGLVADTVWKTIESDRSVSEDQLSILHFLFSKNLERATRIVDQKGVKRISGEPSGRSIFQVVGESKRQEEYLCFPESYCGCYSFFYDNVNRGEQLCVRRSALIHSTYVSINLLQDLVQHWGYALKLNCQTRNWHTYLSNSDCQPNNKKKKQRVIVETIVGLRMFTKMKNMQTLKLHNSVNDGIPDQARFSGEGDGPYRIKRSGYSGQS